MSEAPSESFDPNRESRGSDELGIPELFRGWLQELFAWCPCPSVPFVDGLGRRSTVLRVFVEHELVVDRHIRLEVTEDVLPIGLDTERLDRVQNRLPIRTRVENVCISQLGLSEEVGYFRQSIRPFPKDRLRNTRA